MMMSNRFDLEQQILSCWHITDDIRILHKAVLEGKLDDQELTKDEISNYLLGLETIYNMKFQELFNTLETVIKEGKL